MFNFMKKSSGSNNVVNNGSSSGYGSQGSANNQSEEKEQRKKMKKMRKEKEKREKGSFSMSSDDLLRLDEVRKSLKLRTRRKEKQKLPSGITADYSANFFAPLNRDETDETVQTTPPLPPRRGILKPPPILEHGPLQDLDSDSLLQTNTLKNELIVYENVPRVLSIDSLTDSTTNSSFATPFNLSPSGNDYLTDEFDENLKLPCIPVVKVESRVLTINRRAGPGSDFGFSLRRGLVSENPAKNLKPVIFAEPGQDKTHYTGLLPGDKLLEVNGSPVSEKNRDEIIDMIKSSETSVIVKVEPALELYELSQKYLSSQNGNNLVSKLLNHSS